MAVADDKLQRLFDNELPSDEAEALRRDLSDEDLLKLEALAELSETVRGTVSAEAATP